MNAAATRAALAAAIALAACKHHDPGERAVVRSAACLTCASPASTARLASDEMDETSGIVASAKHPGVFYAHNDSGDRARFFAIDASGARLATFDFSSDEVLDCEDVARGPCDASGARTCLFVGDIGDNFERREGVVVYRIAEPDAIADAKVPSERLRFVYPDGPHDAETLLVHPRTGALVIVTKVKEGASSIFEAPIPLVPGGIATLKKVGSIAAPAGSPRFTGGDVRADATGIVLRTYTHVFFAPMRPEQTIAEALRAPLCSLPVAFEKQGEAVAWLADGTGFVTVSEGVGVALNVTRCEGP